ncbi:TetR family transcriptional regulator [Salinactinospora qingdaonensis]|uniref:TetR family transcriptional regulator n=1 Tax=Salinactinospora qingdaonensis TaxID=702744 RepID=A0ABP7FKH5_9ACTN
MAATPNSSAETTGDRPPGLRDRARRAVRSEVAAVATRLFLERGFAQTTVDQIAAEAGLSRASFFRYFATKEDAVLGHLEGYGQQLRHALSERPRQEPVWEALRHAFDVVLEVISQPEALNIGRMMNETPSLKARHIEKWLAWQELLVPEIAERLTESAAHSPDPRPRALAAAALACLDAALEAWVDSEGTEDLRGLFTEAMAAVSAPVHA